MDHLDCGTYLNDMNDRNCLNISNFNVDNGVNAFGESKDAYKNSSVFINDNIYVGISENDYETVDGLIQDPISQLQKNFVYNSWFIQEPLYAYGSNELSGVGNFETKLQQPEVACNEILDEKVKLIGNNVLASTDLSALATEYTSNLNQVLNRFLDQQKLDFSKNVTFHPNRGLFSNIHKANCNIEQPNQHGLNLRNSCFNESTNPSVPNEFIQNSDLNSIVDLSNNSKKFALFKPNNNSSNPNFTDKMDLNYTYDLSNFRLFANKYALKKTLKDNDLKDCSKLSSNLQKNNWASIFPREKFMQNPEVVIMHPLHTRKIVSIQNMDPPILENSNNPSTHSATQSKNGNLKTFSTSKILQNQCSNAPFLINTQCDVPKIQNDSISKSCNKYRRKQKLSIIPGSDDFIFEVQKIDNDDDADFIQSKISCDKTINTTKNNYIQDPENELPERDIYRQKKVMCNMPDSSTKKIDQIYKEHCDSYQKSDVYNKNLNKSVEKSNFFICSDSDSADSNNNVDGNVKCSNSFKCFKCKKFFKSSRFLIMHKKRCENQHKHTTIIARNKNGYNQCKNTIKAVATPLIDIPVTENKDQSNISVESNKTVVQTSIFNITEKSLKTPIYNSLGNKKISTLELVRIFFAMLFVFSSC